jgi:hypothetical protein
LLKPFGADTTSRTTQVPAKKAPKETDKYDIIGAVPVRVDEVERCYAPNSAMRDRIGSVSPCQHNTFRPTDGKQQLNR